jgi:hypothetical protein
MLQNYKVFGMGKRGEGNPVLIREGERERVKSLEI